MPYEAVSGSSLEGSSSARENFSGQDSSSASSSGNKEIERTSGAEETGSTSEDVLCVYICGAVVRPGVYELPTGSRVYAAIEAAGGFTEEADPRQVNQAAVLADGQQITVLTREELASGAGVPGTGNGASPAADGVEAKRSARVNINTATAEELETLSGIGESRAQDIIAYRTENGSFQSIEDIMKVTGIKQALFNKIKDEITVN